jgi:hypothetical protein
MFTPKARIRQARPIRRHVVRPLSITREPYREPLTPGLRAPPDAGECIGFHHEFIRGYDDEENAD